MLIKLSCLQKHQSNVFTKCPVNCGLCGCFMHLFGVLEGLVFCSKIRCGIWENANYILTGNGIWLLPVKRDSSKLGHGMRDFLPVCWEFKSRTNGKCESSRCALSGASYRSKLYRVILVMIISMKLSSNQQTSGQKTSSSNLMSEKYQV